MMASPSPLPADPGAALAALTSATVTAAERAAACAPMADTIGVLLAGAGDARLRGLMAGMALDPATGPGLARLPGGGLWAAPADAALLMGVAAHLLDHDDDETEVAMAHLSAPCLSAALALAADQPMAALIDAYVTGCQAMLLLGSAVNPALYRAGWHATSVLGVFGATAAAARLLGLDTHAAQQAFGLAASGAGGPRGAFGGEGKPLQVGLAAAQGVRAAQLAAAGWQAAAGALAGERGVLTRMAGDPAPLRAPGPFPPPGFVTKLYPSCTATHAAVAEALALAAGQGAPPTAVRCGVDPFVPRILIAGMPDGPDAARFSLEYCLAHALRHGALGPGAFAPAAFAGGAPADPAIRALMGRIRVEADETLPRGPSGIATGAMVTLTWADGRTATGRREAGPGSRAAPLTDTEMRGKFAAGLAPLCPPAVAGGLWNRLASADFPTAGALLDALPAAFTSTGQHR